MPSQTVHFPPEQYTTIQNYANHNDLSFSSAVQDLCNKGVELDLKNDGHKEGNDE
jgi:hypothetical protein